jgi:DNA-binding transcriptional MerR regulator
MITANTLAKTANVPIYTIRHYTNIGLLKPIRHPGNNYKVYQFSDTTRLRFILAAKNLGFTLTDISQILDEAQHGNSPCPLVRDIIKLRIEENQRKIKEKDGICFRQLVKNAKFDTERRIGLSFNRIGSGNEKLT